MESNQSRKPEFVYRGTTRHWSGNDSSQTESRTCATTDPLVATLFALHCRNFGAAVVHIFPTGEREIEKSTNCFAEIEAEVIVPMIPDDFAAESHTIELDRALEALKRLGIDLPVRLPRGAVRLTQYLQNESRRLTPDEIKQFNRDCGVPDHE